MTHVAGFSPDTVTCLRLAFASSTLPATTAVLNTKDDFTFVVNTEMNYFNLSSTQILKDQFNIMLADFHTIIRRKSVQSGGSSSQTVDAHQFGQIVE